MKQLIHRSASFVATACIAMFFFSSLLAELSGSVEWIKTVKSLIVFPGLFILIPAVAATGATGFMLAGKRRGRVIEAKKKRMPFVALNGIFVLIPAAYFLNEWAAAEAFNTRFYMVQVLELTAGLFNLVLMVLNIKDGRKFTPTRKVIA
ncbi:hypothetical protein [Vibrio sonorensis]|uniref:hypothetical protein n=1 Tax=Vibrio sonorensis TaxID=1004316 RepID=UPI0008D91641|nr:hypothetical protein [Vibrio sonorensis]